MKNLTEIVSDGTRYFIDCSKIVMLTDVAEFKCTNSFFGRFILGMDKEDHYYYFKVKFAGSVECFEFDNREEAMFQLNKLINGKEFG